MNASSDPARGIDLGEPATPLTVLARRGDEVGTLVFRRDRDSASPLLARWAEEGHRFRTLVVYVPNRRGGGFSEFVFTECFLSSYTLTTLSDADDRPTEEVAFYYNKIALVVNEGPARSTGR